MATDSVELQQIAHEAQDIARNVAQRPSTAHLLLAIFTIPGSADQLLRERGCSEDEVLSQLGALGRAPDEAPELYGQALERARQLADDCGHKEAEGLHLLVALTRLSRSSAATLLDRTAFPLATLRTTALGQLLGTMPRRRSQPIPAEQTVREPYRAPALEAIPRGRTSTLPGPLSSPLSSPLSAPHSSPHSPADALPALSHGPRTAVAEVPQPSRAPLPQSLPAPLSQPAGPHGSPLPQGSRPPPSALESALSAPAGSPLTGRWALDPRLFPWLHTHGRNLTLLAAQDALDLAVGREGEVEEVLDILGKRRANNPVLVGEPGVGKTAIVEGLAHRLVQLAGPEPLPGQADRVLIELDVAGLVAGTQLRGSFSERLIGLKDEVKRAEGRVVVFIDELHMLIGAGSTGEGPQDAANELKAALARGEFPCIGATTHDEFRKHIQGDPALERRFVPVLVREPTPRATKGILEGAKSRYEQHHRVRFLDEALEAAANLTARYVRDRFLPDKAFAAIDLAGSRARREAREEVTRDDIARAVARMAGLPEERLLQPDGERFLTLERRLRERIVAHDKPIESIARVLKRNQAGFGSQRPLASLLFVGPSGVGKTETARALADELFPAGVGEGAQNGALVRIALSEYVEPRSVARLVGAAPGYVGYGEGGQLTEAVRRRPACVVLFDEAEKAHPSVLQLLLQVLDEGQLSDGRGRRVDFTAAVIVVTSNAGAQAFGGNGTRAMGFGSASETEHGHAVDPLAQTLPPTPVEHPLTPKALELARAQFPPELWTRFDERLVFAALSREEVARVAQLLLAESSRRLWEERRISFRTGPGLIEHLISSGGYVTALGARPMRQTIERLVESSLADRILAGQVRPGERLLAFAGPAGVDFRKEA
ncbi:MAG: ATP-dependent Clp protease ATP-binding subunit [Deltaproteobacteria bacterium]|nr:ATP-dependent Clp protease ATP-binding subunit [Deltaproteobacteria bacterium]